MCQALNQMLEIERGDAQSLLSSCLQSSVEDRKQVLQYTLNVIH